MVGHGPAASRTRSPVRGASRFEHVGEGDAVHVLHREEQRPADVAEVLHVHDVRVVDLRAQGRFVDEHAHELVLASEVRVDDLQRDGTREAGGAVAPREIELRHAPGLEPRDDAVRTERVTTLEHRCARS